MSDIDPITLAVLAGRMEQIADEMDATLFRAAFNPIIAEAHDASHGIYHATNGDTLVQGKSGLPIFVGVMSFAVKAVIDKAAENGDLEDGDIYIFNDAHRRVPRGLRSTARPAGQSGGHQHRHYRHPDAQHAAATVRAGGSERPTRRARSWGHTAR